MGQKLVVDFDQLQGTLGDLFRLSRHCGDVVADETADPIKHFAAIVEPGRLPIVLRHVFVGQNPNYAGQRLRLRRVDADDPRVRVRAAQDLAVSHVLDLDVHGVFQRAGNLFAGVLDMDALAHHRKISF